MPNERELYPAIIAGANAEGFALCVIEDAGRNKRPFDIIGAAPDGRFVGLEIKVIDQSLGPADVIPWEKFAAHQINWLCEAGRRGSYALVGLYSRSDKALRLYRIPGRSYLREAAEDLWACSLLYREEKWTIWTPILCLETPPPSPIRPLPVSL